ncbi:MAG: polysaccharide deacetylase family protein [Hyphomicrobiaceae bacterium]|nr:polysaccharide deacetylase family protein [Hyphomicrobiaceae bacterium]
MRLPFTIFRQAAIAMGATRADRLVGRRYRGLGAIFILHSVVDDRQEHLFDPLRTGARFLDAVIRQVRAEGTDIVTLDEAMARLASRSARRFACFTLDDGYKDNLTVALPIFEQHAAPFTLFVTTCFLERSANNWWSGLAEAVKQSDALEVPALGRHYVTATLGEKVATYRELVAEVERGRLTDAGLAALFAACRISLPRIMDRDALDESELRKLAASPLVEIGGHTVSHPQLSRLEPGEALREMTENKRWLEGLLDRPVRHFAYPFGDPASCGAREAVIARAAGFQTAVTTRIGNLFPEHRDNPTALPRLRLFSERECLRLVEFQRSGAAGALMTRFGDPVTTM